MASRLITESDIMSGRIGDPIVVDRDCVITPSALDRARLLGLRVIFDRDAPRRGSAAAKAPCDHGGLPDGQYLVVVEGGVEQVFRLGPGGPVRVSGLGGDLGSWPSKDLA